MHCGGSLVISLSVLLLCYFMTTIGYLLNLVSTRCRCQVCRAGADAGARCETGSHGMSSDDHSNANEHDVQSADVDKQLNAESEVDLR